MRLPSPPKISIDRALGATALGFAVLAAWPWLAPASLPEPRTTASADRSIAAAPRLPPLAPPTEYSAIIERPLFSPSRTAEPGAAMALPGAPVGRYRLIGVIAIGPARRALFSDGTRTIAIDQGGRFDNWTVARIEHDRVVLSSQSGETVLNLQTPAPTERR
jgi:hypothetical protein